MGIHDLQVEGSSVVQVPYDLPYDQKDLLLESDIDLLENPGPILNKKLLPRCQVILRV